MAEKNQIIDIKEYHEDNTIDFVIKLPEDLNKLSDDDIIKKFKLSANISCNNFVLFDPELNIKKYDNECQILEDFYHIRYKYYQMRKNNMLERITRESEKYKNQHRFISEIISGELNLYKKHRCEVLQLLNAKKFQ